MTLNGHAAAIRPEQPAKSHGDAPATRTVLSISRMTVHNGPGIRTLILFKECPLRCRWCSTPESQKAGPEIGVYPDRCIRCARCIPLCPKKATRLTDDALLIDRSACDNCGVCVEACHSEAIVLLGKAMTVRELVDQAKKDSVFYRHSRGGVTLSGGEPLLAPSFTLELLKGLKEEGISAGIDTCGHVPRANIEPLLPYVDFFLWDLKHLDPQKHKELTGASNHLILRNARFVSDANIPLSIRLPLIPGYNDSAQNIRAACEFVRTLSSVVEVDLLPVHHL
ncbi:MAG: glycyl-radical enzyme activating protein, partial [Syntrophorhabdales bacterium]